MKLAAHSSDDLAFEARVERLRPDLLQPLARLYPDPAPLAERLITLARAAHASRTPNLRELDQRRVHEPDWFQRPDQLGYAAYTDRFAGTLTGVGEHADYLANLGVTYLHLMPLLTPRPSPNDGGYAVMDYLSVRPDLGDVDDLGVLTTTLRSHGISLCLDLVLNHVAREHEWAAAARAGDESKRAYFHVMSRDEADAYEAALPEVFPDFAPGNFTFDDSLDGWVWTTFHDYQWDLNWANPDVLCEFADIILTLANIGVEVFRLDAIAFLWKRLGTNCQNQPEVHDIVQALHAVTRMAAPAVLFKAEAIVGPDDLPPYLGLDDHAGKVSDLAYHNSLMVQIWSMLATGEVALATQALQRLPQPPSTTSWVTYARCHDDIGWAIDDADAASVGLTGDGHRRFLSEWYAGNSPGSWARGLVFQDNPTTGDRRISGTLASLAGAECADPWATERILLVHSITLGFGGLPVIWMGDELGLLNDPTWSHEPAHADDNRWVHRPRMPWSLTDDNPIRRELTERLSTRSTLPQLHARIPTEVWDTRDPGILLVVRRRDAHDPSPLLGAYNVTATPRTIARDVLAWLGLETERVVDHLGAARVVGDELELPPYAAAWITRGHSESP